MDERRGERAPLSPAGWLGAVVLALMAVLLLAAACGSDGDDDTAAPELDDPAATGEELANTYITLLQDKDLEGLDDFLSDAFMVQRADGSFSQKDQYLQNLPEIGEFSISDVSATQDGDSLVVRWLLTVDEIIDGRQFETAPAPRLSTFVWTDGDWRLLSHASFSAPAEQDADGN